MNRYPSNPLLGLLALFAVAYGLLLLLGAAAILWGMNKPRRKTLGVTLALGGATDPADLEMDAEEVTFNLSDGSASPGWIVKGQADDGPTAVVVHGHRDSRYGSLYRAQMLQQYCHAIAVFDLPGHGDAAAGRCLMGAREADDIRAVMHGLPEALTAGRPRVLLGYSMGAT
ncbi:MAG: alpha/beta fold hydrolase, partial [Planctomycetota bacterium]